MLEAARAGSRPSGAGGSWRRPISLIVASLSPPCYSDQWSILTQQHGIGNQFVDKILARVGDISRSRIRRGASETAFLGQSQALPVPLGSPPPPRAALLKGLWVFLGRAVAL